MNYARRDGAVVGTNEEMPKTDHWAIVEFDSYMSDDGYPEDGQHSHPMTNYYAFTSEGLWQAEVKKRSLETGYSRKPFVAMFVRMAKIEVSATVKVDVK